MRNWIWSFLLVGLLSLQAIAADPIQNARDAFPLIKSEKQAKDLIKELETSPKTVALAYRGAITTMIAEFVNAPWTKLQYFEEGKKLLEEAVKKNNSNPEIRYVRLMVQTHCPGFLDYSSNISEDLKLFSDNIGSYAIKPESKRNMIDFVLTLKDLDSEIRDKLISTKMSI